MNMKETVDVGGPNGGMQMSMEQMQEQINFTLRDMAVGHAVSIASSGQIQDCRNQKDVVTMAAKIYNFLRTGVTT